MKVQNNWSEKLEDLLNHNSPCSYKNYEVINLGEDGYDVQYSVERYRLRGEKYKPDLIIWFLNDNDFRQIEEEILILEYEYQQHNPEATSSVEYGEWRVSMSDYFEQLLQNHYPDETSFLEKQYSLLLSIRKYYSGPIILLSLPYIESKYTSYLSRAANEDNNIYYLTLRDLYSDHHARYFKLYDGHPNIAGHQMIAEDTYQYLVTKYNLCQ